MHATQALSRINHLGKTYMAMSIIISIYNICYIISDSQARYSRFSQVSFVYKLKEYHHMHVQIIHFN